jgi:hypothetical protein
MARFDGSDDPEDIEDAYIQQVIPEEAEELWHNSIEASPTWDQYGAEDHMYLADLFADAVFAGDFGAAEDFLEYLEIDWDDYDIHQFYEAYESLTQ